MVYRRPQNLVYPKVWYRFDVKRPDSGVEIKFKVQDLTEDMFEDAMKLLTKYFMRDEPPCKHIEIQKYPSAVAELEKLWSNTLKDKLSLVCLEDVEGPKNIVGLNVLTIVQKDDDDKPFQTDDKIWAKLFGAVDLVTRSVNIFERYDVDKYLTAYGLVVRPEYRGMNIGKEILRARIPLCKALGVKVTATVFTAAASQVVAQKAGFQVLYEITYEELAKKGFTFPGITGNTKYSKLMALVVE